MHANHASQPFRGALAKIDLIVASQPADAAASHVRLGELGYHLCYEVAAGWEVLQACSHAGCQSTKTAQHGQQAIVSGCAHVVPDA